MPVIWVWMKLRQEEGSLCNWKQTIKNPNFLYLLLTRSKTRFNNRQKGHFVEVTRTITVTMLFCCVLGKRMPSYWDNEKNYICSESLKICTSVTVPVHGKVFTWVQRKVPEVYSAHISAIWIVMEFLKPTGRLVGVDLEQILHQAPALQ